MSTSVTIPVRAADGKRIRVVKTFSEVSLTMRYLDVLKAGIIGMPDGH